MKRPIFCPNLLPAQAKDFNNEKPRETVPCQKTPKPIPLLIDMRKLILLTLDMRRNSSHYNIDMMMVHGV